MGAYLKSAIVVRGNLGEPQINFTLDTEGATSLERLPASTSGERLAIILDGELYSGPRINEPILTGSGQITGKFDDREAFELQNVLENPLRAPSENH